MKSFLGFLRDYTLFIISVPIVLGLFILVVLAADYIISPFVVIGAILLLSWYFWDFIKFTYKSIKKLFIKGSS